MTCGRVRTRGAARHGARADLTRKGAGDASARLACMHWRLDGTRRASRNRSKWAEHKPKAADPPLASGRILDQRNIGVLRPLTKARSCDTLSPPQHPDRSAYILPGPMRERGWRAATFGRRRKRVGWVRMSCGSRLALGGRRPRSRCWDDVPDAAGTVVCSPSRVRGAVASREQFSWSRHLVLTSSLRQVERD